MTKDRMPSPSGHRRPYPFAYYVFVSRSRQPTEVEREAGAYLVGRAEARHLQQFFDPLYDSVGIGICTSEDEVVGGDPRLVALAAAIENGIRDARARSAEWPVTIGYKLDPNRLEPGAAIVENASQSRVLEFLNRLAAMVQHAREHDGFVHIGGGA